MHRLRPTLGYDHAVAWALGYCLLFALVRLAISPTIGVDDVEAIITTQELRLGYIAKQPPLYSWCLGLISAAVGPGLLALTIARYSAIFLTFVLYHRLACRVLHTPTARFLATASLTLFYFVGFLMHRGGTHSAVLIVVTVAFLLTALAALERPTWPRLVLLGVLLGAGMLSKYNFAVVAIAATVAALFDRDARRALRDPRWLVVPAVAALVFLPYGLWLIERRDTVADLYQASVGSAGSGLARRLRAMAEFFKVIAEFGTPFIILAPLVYGRSLAPAAWRRAWGESWPFRFVATYVVAGLACFAATAAVNGTMLLDRYVAPVMIILPLAVFAVAETAAVARLRHRVFTGIIALATAVVLVSLLAWGLRAPPGCGRCRLQKPYPELAMQLQHVGKGTLIAGDEFIGGNLTPLLPLRTYALPWPDYVPPRRGSGEGCLVVWDGEKGPDVPADLRAFVASVRGAWPDEVTVATVSVPARQNPQVTFRWHYATLPPAGDCR